MGRERRKSAKRGNSGETTLGGKIKEKRKIEMRTLAFSQEGVGGKEGREVTGRREEM